MSLNRTIVGVLAGLGALTAVNPAAAGQTASGVVDKAQEAAAEGAERFLETMRQDPWTWFHLIAGAAVLVTLFATGVLRRS
ncbi:MAG: hypothetical protein PSX37_10490, partial [bacterium]|nr:hypothetical protein [bacterium]